MKRVTATLLAIIATATTAFATSLYITSEDRPVTYDELPAEAKSFIENNFANDEVSHIILDRDVISVDYNVSLTSGTKLEFNSRGEWKEVDTRNSIVPNNIVPQAIAEYIKKNYPNREITEIKRNHTYTEVTLKGGLELTFNKNYNVVDVDD
jgi:hypothetical protein